MREPSPVSYLRAVREVPLSQALKDFLVDTTKVSDDIFGGERPRLVRRPAHLSEQLDPEYMPTYDGVHSSNAHIFAANSLRVTLFERRAVASEELNGVLQSASDRLTATKIRSNSKGHSDRYRLNPLPSTLSLVEAQYLAPGEPIRIPISSVVDITDVAAPHRGTEYGLEITPGSDAANIFQQQADAINKEASKARACRPLFGKGKDLSFDFEPEISPRVVPFMRVPNGSPEDHELFLDTMNAGISLELSARSVEWDLKRRPPATL